MIAAALLAPAKINLTLEVLSRRSDGYHALRSVVVPVAIHDELSIAPSDQSNAAGQTFRFTVSDASLAGDDNLVMRACKRIGVTDRPFAVHLTKRIPIGAGLGGGSSDAAAMLLAARSGAFGPLEHLDWLGIARELGSDVPLFLAQTAVLLEGTGERITPIGEVPGWFAVVVFADVHVDTGAAFARLAANGAREQRPRSTSDSLKLITALQRADFAEATPLLANDFEAIASELSPRIGEVFTSFKNCGATPHLSGSGSAVFAITENEADANALADALRDAHRAAASIFVARFLNGDAWR